MKIFLFDMDGVLLESRGYHLALQETVRRMASALGFDGATLSPDDIAAFESGGITCEWDTAAICTALLLCAAWKELPECSLPVSLADVSTAPTPPPGPDFNALARDLVAPDLLPLHPLERARRHFLGADHFNPAQSALLLELIQGARDPQRSLTHRTFQEFVLGGGEYARAYGRPAVLDTESYLLKYDRSNLSQADSARLREWMATPGNAAVVITSRPSNPPAGIFSTPEAELGARLVDLEGIPILGWGGIVWLGRQRGTDPQNYLKPSPVHALAGMRMALGESQETALSAAVELVESGRPDPGWQELAGAQVSVFEDTPGGIVSLRAAEEILMKVGIGIETKFYGIAVKPVKIETLQASGASVFSSISTILKSKP